MKKIPDILWEKNYKVVPSAKQKAWVQRWLELLDANTSYVYSPSIINIVNIIEELLNGFDRDKPRTNFFLLRDLYECCNTDPVLNEYNDIIDFFSSVQFLLDGANCLFNTNGCLKKCKNTKIFMNMLNSFKDNKCKILSEWLNEHNRYRFLTCNYLEDSLINESTDFRQIDILSNNLVAELLINCNYSTSFLSDFCVNTFLKKRRNGDTFVSKAKYFFENFKKEPKHQFTVFMRIQAPKVIQTIHEIGEVKFEKTIPRIFDLIDEITDCDDVTSNEIFKMNRFFFRDNIPENMVFAVAENIISEDAGDAAMQALNKLVFAIRRVKFEYEIRNFSIDRRLYVHDVDCKKLQFFSSKQLYSSRCGSPGNPIRLEQFLSRLEIIDRRYDTLESDKQEIINKLTNTALAWHQGALESQTDEIQFMNHWISLEQLFQTIQNNFDCYKTSGTKAVIALSNMLNHHFDTQILLDFLGDIQRLGLLGSQRVLAKQSGRIEYSETLLNMPKIGKLRMVPYSDITRPELFIVQNGTIYKKYKYKINPGTIVLYPNGSMVKEGIWIAGAYIDKEYKSDVRKLISVDTPKVEDLLYLALYENQIKSADSNIAIGLEHLNFTENDTMRFESKTIDSAIMAMRWFDSIEHIFFNWEDDKVKRIEDFVEILPSIVMKNNITSSGKFNMSTIKRLNKSKSFFYDKYYDQYIYLRKKGKSLLDLETDLPDMVLFEMFRNSKPNIKFFENLLTTKEGLKIESDQKLLQYRLNEIGNFLKNGKKDKPDFLCSVERMRRARNSIAHNADIPRNINMLASYLYKFMRIYLREVIYSFFYKPDLPVDKLLMERIKNIRK